MNIRPLHDRIIVHRLDEGEQRVGGIIIPDNAREKPQQGSVIAVGNGALKGGKRKALDVKVGDHILFGKYSGQEIRLDGQEVFIMKEDDVLAILDSSTRKPVAAPAAGKATKRASRSAAGHAAKKKKTKARR